MYNLNRCATASRGAGGGQLGESQQTSLECSFARTVPPLLWFSRPCTICHPQFSIPTSLALTSYSLSPLSSCILHDHQAPSSLNFVFSASSAEGALIPDPCALQPSHHVGLGWGSPWAGASFPDSSSSRVAFMPCTLPQHILFRVVLYVLTLWHKTESIIFMHLFIYALLSALPWRGLVSLGHRCNTGPRSVPGVLHKHLRTPWTSGAETLHSPEDQMPYCFPFNICLQSNKAKTQNKRIWVNGLSHVSFKRQFQDTWINVLVFSSKTKLYVQTITNHSNWTFLSPWW